MCASCHSTNLQKNYLADVDSFHTTYSVVTVSCESCHGPGKAHIDFVGSSGYKDGDRVKHAYLLPIDSPNVVQVNTCAPCHARKADISPAMVNPRELMETIIPEIPTTEFFHADGQVDDEDYIYTSFLQSKMFHRSVTCTNCHNAHSGKLVLPATQVCGQCHERKYFEFGHTKHEASLTQVNCISCHMPGKYYMGNDYRHDHSFRVPRPDLSVKHGTPNACNDCHTDKKPQWAAEAVAKWYGPQRAYHYAEDLIPGSEAGPSSETHLQKLIADTSVPDIVKATAAHYLSQVPTRTALATLKGLLKHGDPQVRYRSLRSLASFPPGQWRDDVFPLFNDKVRAVRIAAADLCLTIPVEQVPEDFRNAMANARNELSEYLLYQRDFSVGNVMLGDYYYRQNDLLNAEKYYWRGLQKDGQMNYARFNLSALYNTQSKNQDALKVLEEARAIDPQNPRVYYNLGLLYVELQDNGKALDNLSKAVDKGMTDPRLFYNLGILNQQMGKAAEAERIFLKGLKPSPNDPDLNYALAFLYMQQNQLQKALGPASILKRLDPNNPNYQPLFRQLQL
jgi:tetratricopeptide (TPR) repeat protein